jgi:hypothetical protein
MSLVETHSALKKFESAVDYVGYVEANCEDDLKSAEEKLPKCRSEYWRTRTEFQQSTASASLAISDELWKSAQTVSALIDEGYRLVATRQDSSKAAKQIAEGILKFTQDARANDEMFTHHHHGVGIDRLRVRTDHTHSRTSANGSLGDSGKA